MPDVFISYSREDQEHVFPVVDKLRKQGLDIWIDQEGIHGAKLWSQEIVNAIENSKVFILFASTKAFVSKNVTKELALASESDKHILPVFIENADIPAAMKYQLAGIQHLVHEQGQADETVGNILSTLDNLDVQSSESQPAVSAPSPTVTKQVSKKPLGVAALIISLVIIGVLLFNSKNTRDNSIIQVIAKTYKSNIDLCVITISESTTPEEIVKENRALRDELIGKLTRFHEYKIIKGDTLTPDATSLEYIELSKRLKSDFVLQIMYDLKKGNVLTQLFDGKDGRSLWAKSIGQEDVPTDGEIKDESTGIIAGNVAGYDGVIHRKILQKALVKMEDDLTPIELLQIGKAAWEEMTKDSILKAINYLERCISLNPEITTAYAVLGEIYTECLKRDFKGIDNPLIKAKNASDKALQLDPKNSMALIEKFWMLWYEKDYSACELYINLALEANPYEPYVLISAGSFKLVRDVDVEYGLKLCELANKYNEQPQGWYNWPLIVYYSRIGEYKKSLEHSIAGNFKDDNNIAQTAVMYWLNGEKDTSLKKYSDVKNLNKDYSVNDYKRFFIEVYDNKGIDDHLDVLKEIEAAYDKK